MKDIFSNNRGRIFNAVVPFIIAPLVFLWILSINERKAENLNKIIYSTNAVDYIVKDGDTVWNIAKLAQNKGYIKSSDIREIIYYIEIRNNFVKYGIRSGDIVKIPLLSKNFEEEKI